MSRAVKALASWFGSNRTLAEEVGKLLDGCDWVGIPFAGGMCELLYIRASTLVVSDLHQHIINLAYVVATRRRELLAILRPLPFHPKMLTRAQQYCKNYEPEMGDLEAAAHYFVTCWMGRSHKAGTDDQYNGGLSTRWNANGGDSNTRYRSALRALATWEKVMRRCNFSVMDCFAFLDRCEDTRGHGIYCDPPFPGPGDKYKHKFTEADHRRLAAKLSAFKKTRVVCRFYSDHPLIQELYPDDRWTWNREKGRKQTNEEAAEVFLVNQPPAPGLF
jgi:site-specific DNA-adenine methylase